MKKKYSFLLTISIIFHLNLTASWIDKENLNHKTTKNSHELASQQNQETKIDLKDIALYRIAYIQKGNIWIMYEDGKGKQQITQSGNVIAITIRRKIIYYCEMNGEKI